MKKTDFKYISKDKATLIHAIRWEPETEVRAVLQICHGMAEYIDRYDDLASFLAENGIAVVGNDHLGHGASVKTDEDLGFFPEKSGNEYIIGDIHTLYAQTKNRYPDVPYFILGHSMGSFLVRQYITLYGKDLSGALILDTGYQSGFTLKMAKRTALKNMLKNGGHSYSDLIEKASFKGFNKAFEPARTQFDWLNRDEAAVDKYIADPRTGFSFTVSAYYHMFRGMAYADDKANMARIPKDLPLFIASGTMDPVGNMGKGVKKVFDRFVKLGMKEVEMKLYPDARHEIFNELNRAEVYADLLGFIVKHS